MVARTLSVIAGAVALAAVVACSSGSPRTEAASTPPAPPRPGAPCPGVGATAPPSSGGAPLRCVAGADGRSAWQETRSPSDASASSGAACVAASEDRYYRTDRSLVVDAADPQELFVGVEYKGAFRSTDGGATWTQTMKDVRWPNRCFPEPFFAAADPSDPRTIYLSTNGAGIFKSTDAGTTWKALYTSAMFPRSEEFTFDPRTSQTIYATAENPRSASTNPQDVSNVTRGLVYKSTDGGSTWTELTTPLAPDAGNDAIVVSKDDPRHLLAFTLLLRYSSTGSTSTRANGREPDLSGQLGILESTDAGASWTARHALPAGYEAIVYAFHAPTDPRHLYVTPFVGGTVPPRGFFSTDFGQTWTPSTPMIVVAFDPADPTGNRAVGFSTQLPPEQAGRHLLETTDAGRSTRSWMSAGA